MYFVNGRSYDAKCLSVIGFILELLKATAGTVNVRCRWRFSSLSPT